MRHAASSTRRCRRRTPGVGSLQRALLVLAACAAFMMPSFYAGGAEIAHAHAFFQFLLPGSADPFHHHDHHPHDHRADRGHDHRPSTSLSGPMSGAGACERATEGGDRADCAMEATRRPARPAAPVEPSVSPVSHGDGLAAVPNVALGDRAGMPPPESLRWRPGWLVGVLANRSEAPEPPPPRPALPR